jgi:Leucine rich repeat variant
MAGSGDAPVVTRLLERGLLLPHEVDRFDTQIVIAMADVAPVRHDWAWRVAVSPDPAIRAAFAATTHLPGDIVAALADDPDLDVVAEAAKSPMITEPLAERLATHPHVSIRRALACSDHAPSHLLVALAERRMPAPELCPVCDGSGHWLAGHWSCDGTHRDALDDLDYALALNPRTPAEAVSRFAAHPSIHVRWRLAIRTDLPQESYQTLSQDPIPGIRGDVAANQAIGEGLIRAMADDTTYDVRRRLAHNPAIPLDVLAGLAPSAKIGPTLLPRIAAATSAEITALAASPVPAVRMFLAERRDLPRHIVDQLAGDRDAKVLKSLATNPTLSQAQLETMVAAHGPRVAARVAANPSCPPELLLQLARQTPPVQKALRRIAEHPNAPAEALRACLADQQVRRIAASHPALPVETILQLLTDVDIGVAAAVAANPSLPEAVMHDLATAD